MQFQSVKPPHPMTEYYLLVFALLLHRGSSGRWSSSSLYTKRSECRVDCCYPFKELLDYIQEGVSLHLCVFYCQYIGYWSVHIHTDRPVAIRVPCNLHTTLAVAMRFGPLWTVQTLILIDLTTRAAAMQKHTRLALSVFMANE